MFKKVMKVVLGSTMALSVLASVPQEVLAKEINVYSNKYSSPVASSQFLVRDNVLIAPTRNERYVPLSYLTEFEKKEFDFFVATVEEHFSLLQHYGIDVQKLEDFTILFNIQKETKQVLIPETSFYVYTGATPTYNKFNFPQHTIVVNIDRNEKNEAVRHDNMRTAFINAFGHHVGYTSAHKNSQYKEFHEVRGQQFITNDSYLNYSHHWRNSEFEQFADSYTELFVDDFVNRTAVPNLTEHQKHLLLDLISKKIDERFAYPSVAVPFLELPLPMHTH